ncbi:RNA-binding protein [Candidatus Woesearchaeota archaeon]|nr:RNA-binding protein [Candidatus Woesearchaeota archaeon]
MSEQTFCSSCKKDVSNDTGNVSFKCPKCGKEDIIRCTHCRDIAAKYVCHSCKFEGPN